MPSTPINLCSGAIAALGTPGDTQPVGRVEANTGRPVAGAGLVRQRSPRPAPGSARQSGAADAGASSLGLLTQRPETDH